MKGIVLAGGRGSRLYPLTKSMSKQLLPVYDKPMIYYPISVLMLAGISEILIISTPDDLNSYKKLLGTGLKFGVNFSYEAQEKPNGLAEAFIIGRNFIGNDPVCLILGDNIIYGQGLTSILRKTISDVIESNKALVFGIEVENPQSYGVAEVDKDFNILSLYEKPKKPKSNNAVIGLYFYPNKVISEVIKVKPSKRGEKEITTLNNIFLKNNELKYYHLGRGFIWFDAGTPNKLKEACDFIHSVQTRQGKKIACLEEIAINQNFLSIADLKKNISNYSSSGYLDYLLNLTENTNDN